MSPSTERRSDVERVRASDIGSYVYCARAYWLQKVQGGEVTDEAAARLERGTAKHHDHGVRYDWQRRLRRAGLWLVVAAVLVLAARVAWSVLRGGI